MTRLVASETAIAVTVDAARDWLGRPENLPAWTSFFTAVGPADAAGRHPAETRIGAVTVWIEQAEHDGGYELSICSIIRDRPEWARLWLLPDGDTTVARLHVSLLHATDAAAVEAQRTRMAQELQAARRLLEGTVVA